ncbi:unnamed protein product [Lampetra fluviatilis]
MRNGTVHPKIQNKNIWYSRNSCSVSVTDSGSGLATRSSPPRWFYLPARQAKRPSERRSLSLCVFHAASVHGGQDVSPETPRCQQPQLDPSRKEPESTTWARLPQHEALDDPHDSMPKRFGGHSAGRTATSPTDTVATTA